MIDGEVTTFSFAFFSSSLACSKGIGNAKFASPVCSIAARVLLSTTGRQVMLSSFG